MHRRCRASWESRARSQAAQVDRLASRHALDRCFTTSTWSVSNIARSLDFYRGLLGPLGWHGVSNQVGERGETIHYLYGPRLVHWPARVAGVNRRGRRRSLPHWTSPPLPRSGVEGRGRQGHRAACRARRRDLGRARASTRSTETRTTQCSSSTPTASSSRSTGRPTAPTTTSNARPCSREALRPWRQARMPAGAARRAEIGPAAARTHRYPAALRRPPPPQPRRRTAPA